MSTVEEPMNEEEGSGGNSTNMTSNSSTEGQKPKQRAAAAAAVTKAKKRASDFFRGKKESHLSENDITIINITPVNSMFEEEMKGSRSKSASPKRAAAVVRRQSVSKVIRTGFLELHVIQLLSFLFGAVTFIVVVSTSKRSLHTSCTTTEYRQMLFFIVLLFFPFFLK